MTKFTPEMISELRALRINPLNSALDEIERLQARVAELSDHLVTTESQLDHAHLAYQRLDQLLREVLPFVETDITARETDLAARIRAELGDAK